MSPAARAEFDPTLCMDHISLFRNDVKALIDEKFLNRIDGTDHIFGKAQGAKLREILNSHGDDGKKAKAKDFIFETLTRENPDQRIHLVNYFREHCDDRAYKEFLLLKIGAGSREKLEKYFYNRKDGREDVMEHLSRFIRPDEFLEDLKRSRHGKLYESLLDELLPMTTAEMTEAEKKEQKKKAEENKDQKQFLGAAKTRADSEVVACLLLRRLPLHETTTESGDWFFHLLDVLRDSKYHYFLPDAIDKDFNVLLDMFEAEKRSKEVDDELQLQGLEDDYIDVEEAPDAQMFRPQQDYLSYISYRLDMELEPPSEVNLRTYQKELVEQLAGEKNGIVCAPTGSGKTIVATQLMLDHLNERRERNQPARVAMLVPKVPLVYQQLEAIFEYAPRHYNLSGFCGTETMKGRGCVTLASDLVVLTPQVLINMLLSPKRLDHLNICDFTMLVFDECHHCRGDHPYKVLMDLVNDYPREKAPRVIGLTASVGVDRSGTVEGAIKHILELCVSLNSEVISSVQKFKADLDEIVQPPVDELIRVDRFMDSQFCRLLVKFIQEWDEGLRRIVKEAIANRKLIKEFERQVKDPEHGNMEPYLNYLTTFEAYLNSRKTFPEQQQQLRTVEVLKAYALALDNFDLLPNKFVMQELGTRIGAMFFKKKDDEQCPVLDRIEEEWNMLKNLGEENCGDDKPILNMLKSLIENHYKGMADPGVSESRVLVFVQKRFMAGALCHHLNETCAPLFHDPHAVGFITRGLQSGVQRDMLDDFYRGKIKILVATSIAEEGIDVAGCNLIIKYNTSGSVTTFIQRKGRGRAKGSKAYLLALNSRTENQEMDSMRDAYLMERCLLDLKSRGDAAMKRRIEEKRREVEQKRKMDRAMQEARQQELKTKAFDVVCKECDQKICHSSAIRQFSELKKGEAREYIISDPDLWSAVKLALIKHATSHHGAMKIGTFNCSRCSAEIGPLLSFSGVLIPIPRAANLLLCSTVPFNNQLQDRLKITKWSNVATSTFFIGTSKFSDVRNMYRAFIKVHSSMVAEIEKRAEVGRMIESRKERERGRKYREKKLNEAAARDGVQALDTEYVQE